MEENFITPPIEQPTNTPTISDPTPEMKKVKDDIIKKYTVNDAQNEMGRKQQSVDSMFGNASNSLTTTTPFDEVYASVGNEYIARYDTYLRGVDNNERNAQMQSTSSKWANGLAKVGVNLATPAAGSTIGSVTGVANWISEGFEMEALYTDDYNVWLDEVNEKLNYKLPNYYSKQEQDLNFGQSLGTANFWANDLAKGVSFTLGAIVGEGIWAAATGGASLSTTTARWGLRGTEAAKIARGINNYQKLGKKMMRAGFSTGLSRRAAQGAEIVNTARFTYTSAGYEAGVEARQTAKEAEENFEYNFQQQYGREPNEQERADFQSDVTTAANSLWAGNMALVGSSNLAIFGKMFKITDPLLRSGRSLKTSVNKSLFGIGSQVRTEGGRLTREALKPTALQKTLGYTNSFAKSAVIEGFWEEGNQSVMGNIANDWLESGYDIDATKNSYDLMGGIYDGYAETYGSKEGWKEIGIGMMVGVIGGGVSGQWSSYGNALKNEKNYVDAINNKMVGAQTIADKMFTQNQIYKANLDEQQAKENGDYVGQQQARERAILSSVALHKNYDRLDEAYEDFKTALNLQSSENIAEENGIDVETVDAYKQGVLEEYKDIQDRYSNNKDFADYILGKGTTNRNLDNKNKVAEAIAYNMTMGENSSQSASALLDSIQEELLTVVSGSKASEFSTAFQVKNALEQASEKGRRDFEQTQKRRATLQKTKAQLEESIQDANRQVSRVFPTDTITKQQDSENLLKLQRELQDINEQIVESERASELATQALNLRNPFSDNLEYITAQQLDEVAEITDGKITGGTLFEIDNVINSLQERSPEKYERLKKLFFEYEKAVYSFREYNKTVQGISSPNFNPANFATKLNAIIGKNKDANDFTKEFFARIGDQLIFNTAEQTLANQPTQTEQEENEEGDSIGEVVNNNQPEQLSPIESLRNLINEALKKNSLISNYIGEDYSQSQTKPTQGQLEEYKALNAKVNKNGGSTTILGNTTEDLVDRDGFTMTSEEVERFRELNEVFSNWQIQEGTFVEGVDASLADLIERLQQYESQPTQNNVKTTQTNTDAVEITNASERNSTGSRDSVDMLQMARGVYLKIHRDGSRTLSNLSVIGLIEEHIEGEVEIYRKNRTTGVLEEVLDIQTIRDSQKTQGEEFVIVTPNGEVSFSIGDKSRIEFTKTQWEQSADQLGLSFVTAEGIMSSNWVMGYNANGTPAKSDFTQETSAENKIPEMTNEELAAMNSARLQIDPENSYNKILLEQLEQAETKEEIERIKNSLVIEYVSDGKWAGNMRDGNTKLSKSDSAKNFKAIREKAFKKLKDRKGSARIDLGISVGVSYKFKGSPIFNLEGGQLNNSPIDSQQLEVIKDTGYVQNGEMVTGGRVGNVDTSYLPRNAQKTPIIVFRYRGENVAFPVSLVRQPNVAATELSNTLGLNISDGQKINKINELLISNGVSPTQFELQERDLYRTNKIQEIEQILSGIPNYVSVEQLANPNYSLTDLQNDVSSPIDVANNPFGSPKLKMDLVNIDNASPEPPPSRESLIGKELESINKINNFADAFREKKEYTVTDNYTESEFAELHANLENDDKFTSNQQVYSWKTRNVNFISDLVKAASRNKAVRDFYGNEFLNEVKAEITTLNETREQIKATTTAEIPTVVNEEIIEEKQKPCK